MTACCVYRAFDLGGTLLYVGSSITPQARYRHHEFSAPWWPFKVDITETWHRTQREGREAERVAIATEHPRWNVVGRSVDHPDGAINQAFGLSSLPHLREEMAIWREWRELTSRIDSLTHKRRNLADRIAQIAADRSPHFADTA